MAGLRHTASLEEKVKSLRASIEQAVSGSESVRELYKRAEAVQLTPEGAKKAFDMLFPKPEEDASQAAKTRATNTRGDALNVARLPINAVGDTGNLATLWNAATYLVDRQPNGQAKDVRGGDPLDSLLFGSRAERIQEVLATIEVVMADGSLQRMTIPEANAAGVDRKQSGKSLLSEIIPGLDS